MKGRLLACLLLLPHLAACAAPGAIRAEATVPPLQLLEEEGARVDLRLSLSNEGDEPLTLHAMEYDLGVDDRLVAVGSVAMRGTIPPRGSLVLDIPLEFRLEGLEPRRPVLLRGRILLRDPAEEALAVPFRTEAELSH